MKGTNGISKAQPAEKHRWRHQPILSWADSLKPQRSCCLAGFAGSSVARLDLNPAASLPADAKQEQTGLSCQGKTLFPLHFYSSLSSLCLLADESEVEQITATPRGPQPFPPTSSSSSSVTSQPTPRTDPLLHRTLQDSPAAGAGSDLPSGPSPPTPPPASDLDAPKPSPSGGEDEEEEGGAQSAQETKRRTLLEIDRFTLCGNRID